MKIQALSVAFLLLTACAASTEGTEPTGETSEATTSTGWMNVVGAYSGGSTAQFADLVLDPTADAAGHHVYFLDEHAELISCTVGKGCIIRHERETGWYSATATHLMLHPDGAAERIYSYTRKGSTLHLTRSGSTGVFSELASYCDVAADCADQGLIRPYCMTATSGWVCDATAHTCSYACSGATGQ